MTQRSKKKLDTVAFVGAVLALIGFLVWITTTLPRNPY